MLLSTAVSKTAEGMSGTEVLVPQCSKEPTATARNVSAGQGQVVAEYGKETS